MGRLVLATFPSYPHLACGAGEVVHAGGLISSPTINFTAAPHVGLFVQQLPTSADEAANSPCSRWLVRPLWLLLEAFMLIRYQAATSHGLSFSSSLGFMVERNYFQKTITTSLFLMALCLPAVKLL